MARDDNSIMYKKITIFILLGLILSGCGRAQKPQQANTPQEREPVTSVPVELDEDDIEDAYSIRLTSPQLGQVLKSPFLVGGEARLPDDIIYIRIKKPNGDTLIDEQTKIKPAQAGEKGPFSVLISFQFQSTDQGFVEAFGIDPETKKGVSLESVEVSFNL